MYSFVQCVLIERKASLVPSADRLSALTIIAFCLGKYVCRPMSTTRVTCAMLAASLKEGMQSATSNMISPSATSGVPGDDNCRSFRRDNSSCNGGRYCSPRLGKRRIDRRPCGKVHRWSARKFVRLDDLDTRRMDTRSSPQNRCKTAFLADNSGKGTHLLSSATLVQINAAGLRR